MTLLHEERLYWLSKSETGRQLMPVNKTSKPNIKIAEIAAYGIAVTGIGLILLSVLGEGSSWHWPGWLVHFVREDDFVRIRSEAVDNTIVEYDGARGKVRFNADLLESLLAATNSVLESG